MKKRIFWSLVGAGGFVALVVVAATTAYADMMGADIPILAGILSNTVDQLQTSRAVATDTKAMSGSIGTMAADTHALAQRQSEEKAAYEQATLASLPRLHAGPERAFAQAYPELYFKGDVLQAGNGWGRWFNGTGYGATSDLLNCLSSLSGAAVGTRSVDCSAWARTATYDQTAQDLGRMFGEVPQGRPEWAAVRLETVSNEAMRAKELRTQAVISGIVNGDPATGNGGLLRQCENGGDPDVCAKAGSEASIRLLQVAEEGNVKLERVIRQGAVANELQARAAQQDTAVTQQALQQGMTMFGAPAVKAGGK